MSRSLPWLFGATLLLVGTTGCADLTRTSEVRLIKERPVAAKPEAPAAAVAAPAANAAGGIRPQMGMAPAPGAKGG